MHLDCQIITQVKTQVLEGRRSIPSVVMLLHRRRVSFRHLLSGIRLHVQQPQQQPVHVFLARDMLINLPTRPDVQMALTAWVSVQDSANSAVVLL